MIWMFQCALRSNSSVLRKIIAPIGISIALSGCMVGPNHEPPFVPMPTRWTNSNAKMIEPPPNLANWWMRLNDPVLNKLVFEAANSNLDVAAAQARVREARASLEQEIGGLLPAIRSPLSATRQRVPGSSSPFGVSRVFTQFNLGFDASWELDLFGGIRRGIEAAEYGLDASREDLRNTSLVMIGDVALYYSQYRAAQAKLVLARQAARSQRETANLTRTKQDVGTAAVADVARSDALASTTEADIPAFEIDRKSAAHRLGVLLGKPPGDVLAELERGGAIPQLKFPVPEGIPADILNSRPDVRLAERQLAQATARVGVAEAARLPSVSLTGNIATQALSASDIAKKSTIAWAFGPSVTVPIFQGGRLKAAADAAGARRDQAFAKYEAAVLLAMEDVENALVALSQQRMRHGKLLSAANSYRKAADALRVQYREGAVDYLNLLDAQRQSYTIESAEIDARLAMVTAYIALNKALGGTWDEKPVIVSAKI